MDYNSILSDKAKSLKPSGIRKFFDLLEEMKDAISLGIGEPDFVTPWHIRNAGIHSLEKGYTKYTPNAGLSDLRREISGYMRRRFDLEYSFSDQILVTVGGSEAIDLCLRAVICEGDEVIIPEPCFVAYAPIATMAGATPVMIATTAETRFRLTAQQLRDAITPRTKMLVLPFPTNPTGGIMEKHDLEAIADVLRGTNIIVLSDEIYAELTYGQKHVSIANISGMYERTVIASGFSKAFAMTGWRMGYACGPAEILSQMTKIHQFAIMSAPTTSQYSAIEALKNGDSDVAYMVEDYDKRRRYVVDRFNAMGLSCFEPQGAFYCFPDIRASGLQSEEFCERLLVAEKVAVIPGTAFGDSGQGYARCCYATSMASLEEAMNRIERFLNGMK